MQADEAVNGIDDYDADSFEDDDKYEDDEFGEEEPTGHEENDVTSPPANTGLDVTPEWMAALGNQV